MTVLYPQGVRCGCKGLKPQQHTLSASRNILLLDSRLRGNDESNGLFVMNTFLQNLRRLYCLTGALALLIGFATQAGAQQTQTAGSLIMSIGTVSTVREGKEISAPRGTPVLVGDMVRTGASSNAQLKFNDGAIIALRPNSEFKVNAFSYNGKNDGSESASLSLLKGGMRAVTGVIGRSNHDNLKIDAVVATIGVRGTGFNVVLCDAACQASSPGVKGGLYTGVFEGRIAVSNEAGTAVELGVNQFLYVADAKTMPIRLVKPPAMLKDSLAGQSKSAEKKAAAPAPVAVTTSQSSQTADKAPTEAVTQTVTQAVSPANTKGVALALPTNILAPPGKFFDLVGLGDVKPLLAAEPNITFVSFQSAEFNPADRQRRVGNLLPEDGNDTRTLVLTQYDGYKLQTVAINGTSPAYAINNAYTAEGGSDGGVVAWGRWAGGTALIGNYGTVTLTDAQGFHWVAGTRLYAVPAEIQNKSFSFNLIGATRPTEATAGALAGWRVYGGNLNANFGTANVQVSGLMNMYLNQSNGSGNFEMSFSGSSASDSIAFTRVSTSMIRTQGDVPVCVASCAGAGVVAFYGTQASHAGLTYEVNTGSSYIQGAAVFKR